MASLLVRLGFALLLVGLFVSIAVEVRPGGPLGAFDGEVALSVVGLRTPVWNRVFWAASLLGNSPVLAALAAVTVLLLLIWGRVGRALFVGAGMVVAEVVSEVLKAVLARPRPPLSVAIITLPSSHSLPSGHALVLGVFLGLLAALAWRSWPDGRRAAAVIVAVMVAGVVGFSRIYLGVHWLSDVLGGWVLAGAVLFIVLAARRFLAGRAQSQPQSWRGRAPDGRSSGWRRSAWGSAVRRRLVTAGLGLIAVAVLIADALLQPLLG